MVCDEASSTLQRLASFAVHHLEQPCQILAVLNAQVFRHGLSEATLALCGRHGSSRISKVQKGPQLKAGVRPQRMKRPQSIGELGAFALHRIEIGCREIILIKYKPHMVKRLRSIATVFDSEVK